MKIHRYLKTISNLRVFLPILYCDEKSDCEATHHTQCCLMSSPLWILDIRILKCGQNVPKSGYGPFNDSSIFNFLHTAKLLHYFFFQRSALTNTRIILVLLIFSKRYWLQFKIGHPLLKIKKWPSTDYAHGTTLE